MEYGSLIVFREEQVAALSYTKDGLIPTLILKFQEYLPQLFAGIVFRKAFAAGFYTEGVIAE